MSPDEWREKYQIPAAGGGVAQPAPSAPAASVTPGDSSVAQWREKYGLPSAPAGAPPAPQPYGNLLTSGIRTGWNELQGLGDYAIAMGAGIAGAKDTQQEYIKAAQQQFQESQQYNRPELEMYPWQEGYKWSNLPAQMAYQVSKQVPMTFATMGAGGLVGGALERAGINALPKFAAGAVSGAIEDVAGKKIAAETLQKAAQPVAATTVASYPVSAGSVYQQQVEKGDLSPGAALTSSVLAWPHALAESFEIGQLRGLFKKAGDLPSAAASRGVLNWLKGVGSAAVQGHIGEGVAETAQGIVEQSVRTDLTPAQRADAVLQSWFMGSLTGFGMGGGAHAIGSVLAPVKNASPDQVSTPALNAIVDTALNPQTAKQRLDANVEAMTAPGPAPAQRSEPVIGPTSGMRQGAPGPGEAAVEVSPADRIQGGAVVAPPENIAPLRPNVAQAPAQAPGGRVEIPQVAQPPLSTARTSTPLPNAPLAHIENAQLAEMFKQATNPQVREQVRQEMETRLAPTQPTTPAAPTFEQVQKTARQDLVKNLELTGQAAKEAQKLDITHPLEAVPLVQAKIAERAKNNQTLTPLQQRMNERYGLVDAQNQPQSVDDLRAAQEREQLTASTAPNQLVREDAEYRAAQLGEQIKNRTEVDQYVASAAERPATPAPTTPPKPTKKELRSAAQDAIAAVESTENAVHPRYHGNFENGFLEAVANPKATPPKSKYAKQGFEAGRAFAEQMAAPTEVAPAVVEQPAEAATAPAPVPITPEAEDLLAKGGVPFKVTQNLAKIAKDNGLEVTGTGGAEAQQIVEQLRAKQQASVQPVSVAAPAATPTETPNAVQEPSAAGVYVQPAPEVGGAVVQGNAEERQAPGARPEQQVGQAPEITERPTRPLAQSVDDMSVPATPKEGFAEPTQKDKAVSNLTNVMQRAEAYSTTLWNQVERFGKVIPALQSLWKANTLRDSFEAQLAQITMTPLDKFSQLVRQTPASAERIQKIAAEARNGIDARKPWAAQTWLHDKPDVAEYKRRYNEVRQAYFDLQRAGHDKILDNLVDLNTTMWQLTNIVLLYNSLRTQFKNNPTVAPSFAQRLQRLSPVETYLDSTATRDLASTAQHFNKIYEQLRQLAGDYTGQYPNDINSPEMAKALRELDQQQKDYRQAPYFHLGRSGEHIVQFKLPVLESGLVDKEAAKTIVKALSGKGFDGYEIAPLGSDPNVFMLTDSISQRQEMAKTIRDTGLVQTVVDRPVAGEGSQNAAPRVLQELINRLQAAQEADPERSTLNAQMVRTIQKYATDMLGENDARKSLIRRKNIEGFDKNMIGRMAEDIEGRVRMIGRLAGTPAVTDSIAAMRAQAKNAGDPASPDYANRDLINTIASKRAEFETTLGLTPANPVVTFLTGLNYTRNMGFNVSSAAIQGFQIPQLLVPVLMQQKGTSFVKAYQAIGRALGPAYKVMTSVVNEVVKERTFQQYFDASLTTTSIENANIDANLKKFLILYNNTYGAGSNSLARELGHLYNEHEFGPTSGNILGTAQKMGTSMVYYTEMFTRVWAALAAYEAYNGNKTSAEGLRAARDYAGEVNSRAMYDYSQSNVSQLMSRAGPLGPLTPLAGAFLKFQAMFSESFMLNAGRALGMDNYANPEQQAAARRFMAGYLASTVALAGVLGLPMINALAPGWDKLMDLFEPDEEPHDIRTSLIKFIGDMTGRTFDDETARQITRAIVEGVPANLGTPVQSRIGMQDAIPFTKTVWDSTKPIKDRAWDVFQKTGGSPISSLVDMVDGVFKIADGEVEAGLKALAGSPAKNIINAWRMMEDGKFRDSKGKVLPIEDATTVDALRRLVGFSSTKEYEYQLERTAVDRREAPLKQNASQIVEGLALARQNSDTDAYDEYRAQAQDYQDRTGVDLVGRAEKLYKRRQTDLRNAERSGAPLRAPKNDRGLADTVEPYRELRE